MAEAEMTLADQPAMEPLDKKDSIRIAFTFDAESFAALKEMQAQAGDVELGEVVKDALQILRAVQKTAALGYTELGVRQPGTGSELIILDSGRMEEK